MAEVLRESLPDALVYVPAVYSLLVRVLCETPLDATLLSLPLCLCLALAHSLPSVTSGYIRWS